MIPDRIVARLIVAALALPVTLCVLFALGKLLEAMQDQTGAEVLGRVNLGLFALWAVNLVSLLIVSAINTLGRRPPTNLE